MKRVQVNAKDAWSSRDYISTAIVEDDGAIKWESNGRYLMDDVMANIIANGFADFSKEATAAKREAQNVAFFAEYRKAQRAPSQEEVSEMRNAFGAGTVVVDVISGRRIVL